MKKSIRRICLLLSAILVISCAACSKKPAEPGTQPSVDQPIASSGEKFFTQGASPYRIVLPAEPGEYETFAASELQYFIEQATDVVLPIVSDSDVTWSESAELLSVGATSFLAGSGETYEQSDLGVSGYRIARKGKTVFMAGADQHGSLYAVYDFLYYTVGYEFFTDDEIKINRATDLDILDFHVTYVPSLQRRMLGYKPLWDSSTFTRRYKFVDFDEDYIIDGHTFSTILPSSKYGKEHEDWFADPEDPSSQVCFTNDEMRAQFVENCKDLIRQHPDGQYFMLGQNDNAPFCKCADCTAELEHCGTLSGVQIVFVNKVTAALDEWLAAEYPSRRLVYPTYAYLETLEAPTTYDRTTDTYTPVNADVIPRDDVYVLITPLHADFTYSFADSRNSAMRGLMKSWGAVTSNLWVYSYCANFSAYFVPFNNFNVLAENYRLADELNMYAYYEQGANQSITTGFMDLRFYLTAQLMWNVSRDPEELIEKFMHQYYGPAYASMNGYLNAFRVWSAHLQEEIDPPLKVTTSTDIVRERFWPFQLLQNWEKTYFDGAYESIEYLKTADPDLYEKYFNRIMEEHVSLKYLYISLYQAEFTDSEVVALIDEFERYTELFQMNYYQEGKYTKDLIESWRSKL